MNWYSAKLLVLGMIYPLIPHVDHQQSLVVGGFTAAHMIGHPLPDGVGRGMGTLPMMLPQRLKHSFGAKELSMW